MIRSRRHAFFRYILMLTASIGAYVFLTALFRMRTARLGSTEFADEAPTSAHEFGSAYVISNDIVHLFAPFSPSSPQACGLSTDAIVSAYRYVGPLGSSAIIETTASGLQRRYIKGESLEASVTIAQIRAREVELDTAQGRVILVARGGAAQGRVTDGATMSEGVNDGGLTQFQQRLGWSQNNTNEWSVSRKGLLTYYGEVLARKERLGALFDTLEPFRDAVGAIEGYKVNIVGETDFFEAVNFRQGDVIRSVNGITMTNRRRAENLVKRFVLNDLDFIVIDMERDGQAIQQIYHIDQ